MALMRTKWHLDGLFFTGVRISRSHRHTVQSVQSCRRSPDSTTVPIVPIVPTVPIVPCNTIYYAVLLMMND